MIEEIKMKVGRKVVGNIYINKSALLSQGGLRLPRALNTGKSVKYNKRIEYNNNANESNINKKIKNY